MATTGIPDLMPTLGAAFIFAFAIIAAGWLCFCIHSVARAADALERVADALEKDDEEESEVK